MHPYATDSAERERMIFVLAVLSVLAAWVFSKTLDMAQVRVPWWFDAPSTMGFYGTFFMLFDRFLWKSRWLHTLRIVRVPVLQGDWRGYVTSSFDKYSVRHEVAVGINQTWTHMSILMHSESSKSHTLVAAVQVNSPEGVVLTYQYRNEPQPNSVQTMHIHHGTARLVYSGGKKLLGEYYSGRDRKNIGIIELER